MEQINKLLVNNLQHDPFISMEQMEKVLEIIYKKIDSVIPGSALLVSGSSAFYHHYEKYTGRSLINDIDLTLIHNGETIKSLFEAAKKSNQIKMLRNDCLIIPMGVADLHIDLNCKARLQHFRSGVSGSHRMIRYLNKINIDNFYLQMDRPKDANKKMLISLHSPHSKFRN